MEYTLKDAFDALKDTRTERLNKIENLMDVVANNETCSLYETCDLKEIQTKRHRLCYSLLRQVLREEPKDYPIPKTSDLRVEVLTEIQEEVSNVQDLLNKMNARLSDINDDIAYLEKKRLGLKKMKEAYLSAAEIVADSTYEKERRICKNIFLSVKEDLHEVVNILFPNNRGVKEFLGNLISAYSKGGDDVYIEIEPDVLECVNFFIEADIVMYHRNDKNKVRLIDML